MNQFRHEIRDGMKIDWDAPIAMDDGVVLRADVFRPVQDGNYPVILSYGPYAKGLSFQEGYKHAWLRVVKACPGIEKGSTNKYQNWELLDPERWVPDGYVLVRVDSRGAGRSPGHLDAWSAREAKDIAACVDWAGTQPWSNRKVGLNGISYYSMNQWQAAPLKPKHLAAICVWEGSSDYYRELCRHGGILSDFLSTWYPRQVTAVQHGVGERGAKSVVTGEPVAGPPTLPESELANNRVDSDGEAARRELIDDYYRPRLPRFEDIEVPLLSAANWGGMGLHPRGNFEGFLRAGSKQKWLEVHGDTHFTLFYAKYGHDLQKKFVDHFLKGLDNGWDKQPKVLLNIRHPGEKFVPRAETEWPLARTQWTKFFLDPAGRTLGRDAPQAATPLAYATTGDGVTFSTPPMTAPMEITGPVAAKLFVASDTTDADLFLVLRVFDPALRYRGETVLTSSSTQDVGIAFSYKQKTFIHVIDQYLDNERSKVTNDLEFTGCVDRIDFVPRPWVPQDAYNSTGDRLRAITVDQMIQHTLAHRTDRVLDLKRGAGVGRRYFARGLVNCGRKLGGRRNTLVRCRR